MTASTDFLIDLDAARRERAFPDGIPFRFGGETFIAPSELPADVFDPFFAPELGVLDLIKTAFAARDGEESDVFDLVVDSLLTRPALPLELRDAVYASLRLLLGAEPFEKFMAHRPGLVTLATLIKGLFRQYGVGLGEAFRSSGSSESGGSTSKQTSDGSTDSTPATSGAAPEPATGTSASADSATS